MLGGRRMAERGVSYSRAALTTQPLYLPLGPQFLSWFASNAQLLSTCCPQFQSWPRDSAPGPQCHTQALLFRVHAPTKVPGDFHHQCRQRAPTDRPVVNRDVWTLGSQSWLISLITRGGATPLFGHHCILADSRLGWSELQYARRGHSSARPLEKHHYSRSSQTSGGPHLQHYLKAEARALAEPETCTCSMSENDLQMDFWNTACFYTGDSLSSEVVFRAIEKLLYRKKAQFFIPTVGNLRLSCKTLYTLFKYLNFGRSLLKSASPLFPYRLNQHH